MLGDREFISDASIKRLTQLIHLEIGGNRVTDDAISRLTNLTFLDIDENEIISFDAVKNLTKLKKIHIDILQKQNHCKRA